MKITFDPAKNAKNIAERGLPFSLVEEFDWSQAVIIEDTRKDYGERRWRAFGYISPLKNGLAWHRDVPPSFAGSERAKKIVRLAEAPLANRQLKKPGTAFSTD